MKLAMCLFARALVLAFLCIGRAAALTTLGGFRHQEGVVNSAMVALMQHDKPTTDDLEQVAAHLAQLASAKMNGEQMGVNATAIADAISQLVSTIKTEATNAVSQTQGILNGLHSAITQCDPPSNSQALISSLVDNQTSSSTTHMTCQGNLQTLTGTHTQCNLLVASLKSQRDTACQLVVGGSLAPTPDAQVCHQSNSETYKNWVTRLAGYFDTAKTDYLGRETTCSNLGDHVTSNTSRCNDLQSGLNNKQQECNSARTALNTAGCALANTQASVCHNYNCCYSDTTDAYTVARTNAEQEEIAFVAQWKALAHIECLLDVMVQADVNTAKINACLTEAVSTTSVELSYQNVPNKLPCTLPTEYPCTPQWEQQHQIGDTCVPCQGIEDSTSCGSSGGSGSGGGGAVEWVQQKSTQCGATDEMNAAAEAAIGRQNMYSPDNNQNSHLKDYGGQSKTLAQCQADCLANTMCRGIEVSSNSADPSHSAGCALMHSGHGSAGWSGSCWYIKKNGDVWRH